LRDFGRILLFGACGAGGAVAGVFCGLIAADSAARAFGDPFQFYHFAVVLAFVGAGIAIGMIIAHALSLERVVLNPSSILAAATWGSACALAGFVIAEELAPGSHAADFTTVAWGAMGGFLGWTVAMLLDRYRLIPAVGGGMTAGALVGWLFFDPTAQVIDIVTTGAALGFLIPATIVLSDSDSRRLISSGRVKIYLKHLVDRPRTRSSGNGSAELT
jgi:hypothetical protein